MTMVMMTALAVTRERERGTMEALLAMPVRPSEVMAGKILPYIGVGYVQVVIIVAAARWLFDVPLFGSLARSTIPPSASASRMATSSSSCSSCSSSSGA